MKKEVIVIIIILALLLASIVYLFILYNKNTELNQKYSQLSIDKNKAVSDMEQCKTDLQEKNSELTMLQEDYSKLKKSCITENACKNKFPFMRYKCNSQGDAVTNGDKICECDENCELIIT